MVWTTILNNEHLIITADKEQGIIMIETSSGGYRPKYVTLHLNEAEIDEMMSALSAAKQHLIAPASPNKKQGRVFPWIPK
ncbi:hypothetical protein [Paenibacillus gansuensis]|uniref:Uncharacterized protein n=1 Tax=Paenibacillus gansuensis TaxID=306542 RepID=A0ABW5PIC8_9BACL